MPHNDTASSETDDGVSRRKTLKYMGVAASGVALAGCSGSGGTGGGGGSGGTGTAVGDSSSGDITIVWTDHFPPGDFRPLDLTSRRLMSNVEERTGGQVTFEYHPGGELGGSGETMSLVQSGAADAGHIVPSYYSDIVPYTIVGDLPAMGDGTLAPSKAIHDMLMPWRDGLLFEADWKDKGIQPILTSVSAQYRVASAAGAIQTMSDLEGLNVRTGGGPAAAQAKALGGSPVDMGANSIYQAFERGTIDADMNGMEIWDVYSLYEVFGHITWNTPLVRNTLFEGMNMQTWNSLPGDVKEIFRDESNKNAKVWSEGLKSYRKSADKRFQEEYGINFYELPSKERSAWEKALTTDVVDPWVSRRPDSELGQKVLTAYRNGIKEYQ